jgi:murein L,D-transpeptidase YcbB/YkuD
MPFCELKIVHVNRPDNDDGVAVHLAKLAAGSDPHAAIRAFQARAGLGTTGTIDDALRRKLKTYNDTTQNETTLYTPGGS